MNKYKIVFIKNEYIDFVNEYPERVKQLLIDEKSMFDSKQLNLFFENSQLAIYYFEKELFLREDYSYFHGIHKIENTITNNSITFIINQFDIEVYENTANYIIFEYLRNFSSNFFMFDI